MKIKELYKLYGGTRTTCAAQTGLCYTTLASWDTKGHIPLKAQLAIEKGLGNGLVAKLEDAEPYYKKWIRAKKRRGEEIE
jgi:hypothetical protein